MKKQNDIIMDDSAFEKMFVHTMHKVGREHDIDRINRIHEMSAEEFRQVIGANTGMKPSLSRRVIRYASAACVALLFMLSGGIGGIQYSAYRQTVNIGDRYLAQISSDVSSMKAAVSEEVSNKLETYFHDVAAGENLKSAISNLQEVYLLSADDSSEYNYFRNFIAWNLAMAYLKNGQQKAAIPILNEIIADPGNEDKAIQEQAQKTLDDINSIVSIW